MTTHQDPSAGDDAAVAAPPGPAAVGATDPGTAGPTERRGGVLPVLAMAVTVLLWASAFVVIRHLGADVSPGPLTLGRLVVGALALGALVLATRPPRPRRADWPPLVAVGLLWFGVYNLALNAAELRVDAGTAAMLVNVAPVVLAVLAGLVLGEGFPRSLLVGSVVGLVGVAVIGVTTSTGVRADVWGVVLCLVAAVAYAIAVVQQKPLLTRMSALQVTWLACTVGAVACLPFAPGLVRELAAADVTTTLGVVYLGLFPTAVAFTTWAYALARTSAGRLGATTYLVPPIAVVLSWWLLDEVPPVLALVGGALCLLGVSLTRRRPRPRVSDRGRTVVGGGRD